MSDGQKSLSVVRKMNAKSLGFGKAEIMKAIVEKTKANGDSVKLYRIVGVASDCRVGDGQYGRWYQFIGEFGARIPGVKEPIQSNKCFVPEVFQSPLYVAVMKDKNAKGAGVEFAIDVLVVRDDKSSVGYVFDVEVLKKLQESNTVKKLFDEADEIAKSKK